MIKKISLILIAISYYFFTAHQVQALSLPAVEVNQEQSRISLQPQTKIGQTFVAPTDQFNTIEIKFFNYYLTEDNPVVFRLKQIGAEDWLYESTYNAIQFYNGWYYPFGFPPVTEAKGKTYYFELECLGEKLDDRQAVQVYLASDVYSQGRSKIGADNWQEEDLNFRVLANTSYQDLITQMIIEVQTKLQQQSTFFIFYFGLIALTSWFLVLNLIQLKKDHESNND